MPRIPKILHLCFGLSANFGFKPWSLVHYICVKSAVERIAPEKAFLYYEYEPSGPWWELIKPFVELVKIEAPRTVFGRPVQHTAHRADVLRLQKLIEHGGIYLDCDVLVRRDFDDLLNNSVVIGRDSFSIDGDGTPTTFGLSNAVLLTEPQAPFMKKWYDNYRTFRGDRWTEHSTELPLKLAAEFSNDITVLPHTAFSWPMFYDEHLRWIFEPNQPPISHDAYSYHLWETISWERYLEHLTPGLVRETASNFSEWATPLLVGLPDDFAKPSISERLTAKTFNRARSMKRSARNLAGKLQASRKN